MDGEEGTEPGEPRSGTDRFRILLVCTANVCRSPMAEQILRHRLQERLGPSSQHFGLASAGTHALVGEDLQPLARTALGELEVPIPPALSARQLVTSMVEQADLVLTAERSHRALVVSDVPSAARRVFTLRQFARLCRAGLRAPVGPTLAGGQGLMELAELGRPLVQPVDPAQDAITDPMGGDMDAFRDCAELTWRSVDALLDPLRPG